VRFDAYVQRLKASVTQSPGVLSPEVRAAIVERNAQKIPPALAPYVNKVALHAHMVTDEDLLQLQREGLSEDEIFEATAAAAVGAALLRLEKGMAALRGA
jgi:alkylhydroperoxidase family enzyme